MVFTQKEIGRKVPGWMVRTFGTSELIHPIDTIINGFHFPYPLNGTSNIQYQEDFDDE